ncbi:MAG: thiamine pyrophosphate-dependent enzyme [Chitinophagaceae bacterium]
MKLLNLHWKNLSFDKFRNEVLKDYRVVCESREASLLGRKEVLTGKAKFGIFGDGKEVAQVAMAKFFKEGDFRAGYYRDQTFMFAAGLSTIEQFFSQLYSDPDLNHDPFSAGRQMNSHFATKFVDENGEWLDLANKKMFQQILHQLPVKCQEHWGWHLHQNYSGRKRPLRS